MNQIKGGENLLAHLEEHFDQFTPAQRSIAHYLLSHPDEAPFLGVDELASNANTTASTVVRFAKQLGYQGYPELQKNVKELLLQKIRSYGQLERAKYFDLPEKETAVYLSLRNDLANLNILLQTIKEDDIKRFVDVILASSNKYVIGNRSSYSLAHFFYYQTRKIVPHTYLIKNCGADASDLIRDMKPEDVLIAISFPRFTKLTLNYASCAHRKRVKVVSITDSRTSALFKLSRAALFCPYEGATYHASNVVPMAMVNAVIAEMFSRNRKEAIQQLEEEEAVLQELDVLGMLKGRISNTMV